jgi:hypothetical protein
MTEAKPLTASSTIGQWLTDPAGGPLVRGLLAQTGASEEMLAPIKGLPLQQLVALSQGSCRSRHWTTSLFKPTAASLQSRTKKPGGSSRSHATDSQVRL